TAQRHPDRLADDCRFTNSCIRHSILTEFFLQVRPPLINASEQADIFSNADQVRYAVKRRIKTGANDFEAAKLRWIFRVSGRHNRPTQSRLCSFALEVAPITTLVHL